MSIFVLIPRAPVSTGWHIEDQVMSACIVGCITGEEAWFYVTESFIVGSKHTSSLFQKTLSLSCRAVSKFALCSRGGYHFCLPWQFEQMKSGNKDNPESLTREVPVNGSVAQRSVSFLFSFNDVAKCIWKMLPRVTQTYSRNLVQKINGTELKIVQYGFPMVTFLFQWWLLFIFLSHLHYWGGASEAQSL